MSTSQRKLIMQIHLAVHEILADKAFTATDVLISQSFVVAFVHPIYVQIASFRAFQRNLVCENRSTGCGDIS